MKRIVLLAALLAASLAHAQTTLTANHVSASLNGTPLASGKLCLSPVRKGQPSGFTTGTAQVLPTQVCYPVTNGSIGSGITVPDTALASPSGIGYQVQIQNAAGTPTYNLPQPIYPTGTTWSFDTYAPASSVLVTSPAISYGVNAPQGRCGTAPAIFYTPTGVYNCVNQIWVPAPGQVGASLPLNGGSMLGALNLFADPTANLQAATKQYVDSASLATKAAGVAKSGDTMTGALNLFADPTTNLQAATKQYVDAHAGSGSGSVTLSSVAGVFHRTQTSTTTVMSTVFDEGTSGATLAGTTPRTYTGSDTWHFGDGGTVWNFQSGGGIAAPSPSAGPTGGPYIDVGVANYTVHFSGVNCGGNFLMAMLRYTDTSNMVFLNDNCSNSLQVYNYVNGDYSGAPFLSGSMNSNDFYVTLNGQSITITSAGYAPITGTIPNSDNATSTKLGFALEGGANGALAGLTVTTPQTSQVACPAGYTNTDGSCTQLASVNSGVASDGSGKLTSMPELQTKTDASGVTSIVCQEDMAKGRFDARCPKYAGGVYGPTPGEALQKVADAMMCYNAMNNLHSSLELPTGNFLVGSSEYPHLQFGSGSYIYSAADSIQGYGTIFTGTYNNHSVVQVNTGQSAPCSDGQVHTDYVGGGKLQGIAVHGCGDRNCLNWPGSSNVPADTGDYPSGGLNQAGIFYGDSQGRLTMVGAYNNGGYGINCGGQDSECDHLFTQLNNEWLLYGRQQAGQTFDPSTFGQTGDVILTSIDGRLHDVETYGTNIDPGPEYGHLCGVVLGGGNVSADRLFLQVHEIGLCVPFGNGPTRVTNSRIDFSHGESILDKNGSTTYLQVEVDGYCGKQSVVTALGGHCDGIDNSGGPGNTFAYISMTRTNGSVFPTSYATGEVWAHDGGHYKGGMEAARIEQPITIPLGVNVEREWLSNYVGVTGDLWDVSVSNHLAPQDSAPQIVTGLAQGRTAFLGEDIWIRGNHNVTLKSTANGGHWTTCDHLDLHQVDNVPYHFVVTSGSIYDDPPEMQEVCDGFISASDPDRVGTLQLASGTATKTFTRTDLLHSCTANDNDGPNSIQVSAPSQTSVTFTGTGTDHLTYACSLTQP